tara:strand:+ start:439 stop:747 length:309 start_codon:yes stop_codon:yes gene_type:complete
MVRSELLSKLCDMHVNIRRADMKEIISIVLAEIIDALNRGQSFQARGFGSFKLTTRKARIGRNPKTGEQNIQIPAKRAIRYKISKTFFNRLNKNFTENKKNI